MNKFQSLGALLLVLLAACAWAQDDTQQPAASATAQTPGAAPAAGQSATPPESTSQFPPLSGLDEGSLEPGFSARSYLLPGAQVSELADTNAGNGLGKGTNVTGVTHLLGSLSLERLWERYQTALDYVGGGAIYDTGARNDSQVHSLSLDSRVLWRTGQLAIRDRFSYLPEGAFGGSFGGVGGLGNSLGNLGGTGLGGIGGGGGGTTSFFGTGVLGSIGTTPHVDNLGIIDIAQSINPRSSLTLAGGFNLVHFTKASGGLLIDSQQATGQAGYNYRLNRRNQIALVYGYQHFHFPTVGGASFETHVAQFLYGHQITGRMSLLLGAGPQVTRFHNPVTGTTTQISASARASLRYKFPRTTVALMYSRHNSAASGFFAGAITDVVSFNVTRPISRRWTFNGDVGFSRSRRLQTITQGVNANSFDSGYAGARLNHIFNRNFQGFVLYQFSDLFFDKTFCGTAGSCNRTSTRQLVGVGLTWHPRPIRLD